MLSKRERSGLWRHFPLNASFEGHCLPCQREKWDERGSPVRLPGSLLWTLWRMAPIVFTWSFCIFSDDYTEPSEEGSCLQEFGECLQLRCDLIQYCFSKQRLLDSAEGGVSISPDGAGALRYFQIPEYRERKSQWVSWLFVDLERIRTRNKKTWIHSVT